jgi:hypothetical protein
LNLAWVHRYSSFRDDVTQEKDLLQPKLIFA